MRPPQNAGEDRLRLLERRRPLLAASMRPPQNAGEDSPRAWTHERRALASMRPPQNAGEDDASRVERGAAAAGGFNETPAERGGRRIADRKLREKRRALQ